MAFREGKLPEECTWQMAILSIKGNGDFRGISLVEVLWNTVLIVINRQIVSAVQFHDVLHVFWRG